MDIWVLWHGQNGYEVELTQVPWWALAASRFTELVDEATGHHLCGSNSPDWMWRLPLGRPVYDASVVEEGEEPFLVNSLAGALCDFFSWAGCLDVHAARPLYRFPVSVEVALALGAEVEEEDSA